MGRLIATADRALLIDFISQTRTLSFTTCIPQTFPADFNAATRVLFEWATRHVGPQPRQAISYVNFRPGTGIAEHTDKRLTGAFSEALLAVHWEKGAQFSAPSLLPINPGEMWSFDASEPHSAFNGSAAPMMMLLFQVTGGVDG